MNIAKEIVSHIKALGGNFGDVEKIAQSVAEIVEREIKTVTSDLENRLKTLEENFAGIEHKVAGKIELVESSFNAFKTIVANDLDHIINGKDAYYQRIANQQEVKSTPEQAEASIAAANAPAA